MARYIEIGIIILGIVGSLITVIEFILKWRFGRLKTHFPYYEISFSLEQKDGKLPKNLVTVERKNENEIPGKSKWFYATPHTKKWKKMKISKGKTKLKAMINEKEKGWYPIDEIINEEEKRRFQFPMGEPIIFWRFEYKSRHGWHCSYEIFAFYNLKWKPLAILKGHKSNYDAKTEWDMNRKRKKLSDAPGKIIKQWKKGKFDLTELHNKFIESILDKEKEGRRK